MDSAVCVFRRSEVVVSRTVDAQLRVSNDLLDLACLLEVGERFPCKRAVNLQAIDEGGNGDEAVGLDILLELVVGLLVEDDSVVGLVLDCVAVSGDIRGKCAERAGTGAKVSSDATEASGILPRVLDMCLMCTVRYHVPLPLDHFFFCFLPPVAAGAYV